MPGSGFLPVNDPTDPATLIVLLSTTPGQINLYDGLQTLFDGDTASPFALRTVLHRSTDGERDLHQAVPFERARFTCTPGAALSAARLHLHRAAGGELHRQRGTARAAPALRAETGDALVSVGSSIRHVVVTVVQRSTR